MKENKEHPIKVLHVLYVMMEGGGIQKWLTDILSHIDRERFQMDFLVHILLPCSFVQIIHSFDSKIVLCPHPKKYSWFPPLYDAKLKKILRHGKYDIIHSHTAHFNGYILKLAEQVNIPVRIAHSHNDSTLSDASYGLFRRLYINWTKSLIMKHATLGLGASEKAATYMFGKAWRNDLRWQLLYCSLDLSAFKKPIDSRNVRSELGISQDDFVIGHVGRLVHQKNPLFIVEIAAEVAKIKPNIRILFVGDGEIRPQIEQKASQYGLSKNVIFAGASTNVARLMIGAMDVFLFPSFYEGLGLALIEAQASGLPCILSDVVPEEADVVKPLIQRICLSQSASVWAKAVMKAKELVIDREEALAIVEKSRFNINLGVKRLEEIYQFSVLNHLY